MIGGRLATALPWLGTCWVLAGAGQQAAVALGWLSIGPLPGQAAAGQAYCLTPGLWALAILGIALFAACAVDYDVRAAPAIAIAAALLVIARFYAFDPYYAPTLRRASDGGSVAGAWIVLVVACALGAAFLAVHWRRLGVAATASVCWLALVTALQAGLGH
jgi:hypothetical protein